MLAPQRLISPRNLGVYLPPNNPKASSRGEKAQPTFGAARFAPLQRNLLVMLGHQVAFSLPIRVYDGPAFTACQPFLPSYLTEIAQFTLMSQLFDHLGPQFGQVDIYLVFDVGQPRLLIGPSPASAFLCGFIVYVIPTLVFVHFSLLLFSPNYPISFFDAHPQSYLCHPLQYL
jgi:hypothetical protein